MSVTFKVLLTVSNSVCLSAPLLDGGYRLRGWVGLRITERAAVTSISVCCLTWHRIRSCTKRKHYAGEGAAVLMGPSGEMAWGDTSHHATPCLFTVPTVWPGQLSWGRWGERGQCPPLYRNSHPGHSQKGIIHIAWGAISRQHNPEWEIKPCAAQTQSQSGPSWHFSICVRIQQQGKIEGLNNKR